MHILLFFYFLLVQTVENCPNICSCKWKGGKEWVECTSRELRTLPLGAREETQVFDLSGNQLLNLAADCFFTLRLFNLQKLYLGRSHIRHIAARAFTGLQGLVELDLSENDLDQIPSDTFVSIVNLMRLSLAGNPLKVLYNDTFINLDQLNFLDLSHCQLSLLELRAFAGLRVLEWLRLNDNCLSDIPQTVLPLSTSLRGLSLHGNPWYCDCRLGPLQDWLKASQIQIPQDIDPSCAEPLRLKARIVRTLTPQELACIPKIKVTDHLDIYEGDNATLNCEVQAIPRPQIAWLINDEFINTEYSTTEDERIRYTYSEQISDEKIIASLNIFGVQQSNEGNYICQAENVAGISWSNLTIRVLYNEHNIISTSFENPKMEYVSAIAVAALLGTLLALGLLFLSIFLYARHLHMFSKTNLEQPSCSKVIVPQSILKKTADDSLNKIRVLNDFTYSMSYSIDNSMLIHDTNTNQELDADIDKYNEQVKENYNQSKYIPKKFLFEPDLINQVPCKKNILSHYRRSYEPYSEPFSSYLDCDGYPLNFGLPKLDSTFTQSQRDITYKTLPRMNQHQLVFSSDSKTSHIIPVEREHEFLTCAHNYAVNPIFGIDYMNIIPKFVVSSSPIDYITNQNINNTTELTAYSFYQNKMLMDAKISENLACMSSKNIIELSLNELSECLQIFEHPESPDEGYVGDSMDI